MRIAYLCSIAIVAPTLAYAEPQCVLQVSPVAAEASAGTAKEEVGLPVASSRARSGGTPEPSGGPLLAGSAAPVLNHVVAAGAQVTEIGTNHGLLVVVARNDGQFMRLYIAPDGQALVAGLMSDLTVEDLITMAAGKVAELGTFHGMRGIFVANGKQFQVFYATPDEQRVIPGAMFGRSTLMAKAMLSLPRDEMVAAWSGNKLTNAAEPAADLRLAANQASASTIGLRGTPPILWRKADGTEGRADGLPSNLDALVASIGSMP